MSTRRKLAAPCAVLALVATAPSGAQDLPYPSPTLTCSDTSASVQQGMTLVRQLPCTEGGRLRELATGFIRTVAGNGSQGWTGDGGPATEAALNFPEGVVVDFAGNLLIADSFNHRIRRVDGATGVITTISGLGTPGFAGDGGPAAQALLSEPRRVALDVAGNLFFTDVGNQRIRRIDAASGIITTVVGGGTATGDGIPATAAANFFHLSGLAFDAAGNLFLIGENSVRRVTSGADALITGATDEILTTVGGIGIAGFSGDGGPALTAQFWSIQDLAFDLAGNLYIADALNNRVRRVVPGGDGQISGSDDEIVSTFAGGGVLADDGIPATDAQLNQPWGVTVDHLGNVFVADLLSVTVRRVDTVSGIISTVAGGGSASGEDIPATDSGLFNFRGLDTDAEGNLFIAESGAHRIPAVRLAPPFTFEIVSPPSHGAATLSAGGELTYEPMATFVGEDSLTFRARDSIGRTSSPATLAITVTAGPDADIAVSATVFPTAGVTVDGKIAYTVTVTNHGPAAATGVSLTDTLPDGINLNYVLVSPSQGTCRSSFASVFCTLGSIQKDGQATVSIVVHALDVLPKTNSVSAFASQPDVNTANNTASVSSIVTSVVLTDLAITNTGSPDPVLVGSPLTYRLTVNNLGNSCANNVSVTDALPQGVNLVSVTTTRGICTGLQCSLGTLCPGQNALITIVATPTVAGTLMNQATVADRPSDPGTNNTATATTTAIPASVAISVAESIVVSDSVGLLPAALINVAELILVVDAPLVVPPVTISVAETVLVSDASTVIPPAVIAVAESVVVDDAVTPP